MSTAREGDPGVPTDAQELRAAGEQFRRDFETVRDQIARVVVGQRETIENVLVCLFVGGHVLLEGVPGIGKTLLVRTLANSLSLSFGRVQFTPDLMPADVTGTTVVVESENAQGQRERRFQFQHGPVFAQILLADEINRATPKTQSALLEAMQERAVTVGGQTHTLPAPFLVMATQNPVEQEGTYPLPEAQLDRFLFKLLVLSPTRKDLAQILERTTGAANVHAEPVLNAHAILRHQSIIRTVAIAPHIQDYAVRLVLATQPSPLVSPGEASFAPPMVNQFVRLGASPRAAQALVLAGKCRALLDGRSAVSADDLRAAALPALRHRIILNFEASAEGVTTDAVVSNILATLPVQAS
ncbi:MAG TPA: MoxR family ATPase [Phycisphaerales bacterium]|nr:MoxR family ATPase [Phycisphaerales bacterium]